MFLLCLINVSINHHFGNVIFRFGWFWLSQMEYAMLWMAMNGFYSIITEATRRSERVRLWDYALSSSVCGCRSAFEPLHFGNPPVICLNDGNSNLLGNPQQIQKVDGKGNKNGTVIMKQEDYFGECHTGGYHRTTHMQHDIPWHNLIMLDIFLSSLAPIGFFSLALSLYGFLSLFLSWCFHFSSLSLTIKTYANF